MRANNRKSDELRPISLEPGVAVHAEGSCMARFGRTEVLCTASWQRGVPPWLRGSGGGWLTAEYGMLPRATHSRGRREAAQGRPSGRTQEIQRLIGRSLRAVIDLTRLGENQIIVDCDVIQADGGTRTAAVTGGWLALALACRHLRRQGKLETDPLQGQVAAISCGLSGRAALLDLDYDEDSGADVDANFVMMATGGVVELQATGEQRDFDWSEFESLAGLARKGCNQLFDIQKRALD